MATLDNAARPDVGVEQTLGLDSLPLARVRAGWTAAFLAVAVVAALLRLPALRPLVLGYHESGYALDAWRLLTGVGALGPYHEVAPGYSQLLAVTLYALGGGDLAVRALGFLSGLGAVLLCVPLARLIGRGAALLCALILGLSPFWVHASSVAAPDSVAVLLAILGLAFLPGARLRPRRLVAAGALAGYLLSLGPAGIWLGLGLLLCVAWGGRGHWTPGRAATSVAAWAVAGLAGLTSVFSARPELPSWSTPTAGGTGALESLAQVAVSVPFAAACAGVLTAALAASRASGWVVIPRGAAILAAGAVGLTLLGLLLPAGVRPPPIVPALALTLAGAYLLDRGLRQLLGAGVIPAGAALLVGLAAIGALLPFGRTPLLSAPTGTARAEGAPRDLRRALDRVRNVSAELYVLDRSLAEPRGGRRLAVEIAPSLASWGAWYLRDFERVWVWPEAGRTPEVQLLSGGRPRPQPGAVTESVGPGLTLAWSAGTWAKIDPAAGGAVAPRRARYNLFDQAPPGDQPGQLDGPLDAALDPAGNFYVVDQNNSRVQKYAPDGRFLLQWGEVGEEDGQFADAGESLGPTGITVTDRYVWVADTWNHRIQQFRPDGSFVRAWGSFADTKGDPELNRESPRAFYGPRGIAVGPDGSLYITDTGNKRVVVYTQDGRYVRQWGVGGSGATELDEPIGIAVDRRGRVYVADTRNARIQAFDTRGKHLRSWGVGEWSGEGRLEPYLDTDERGAVYVTDPIQQSVYKYSPAGVRLATRTEAGGSELLTPLGLAVSPRGRVYAVDAGLSNVLDLGVVR